MNGRNEEMIDLQTAVRPRCPSQDDLGTNGQAIWAMADALDEILRSQGRTAEVPKDETAENLWKILDSTIGTFQDPSAFRAEHHLALTCLEELSHHAA